MAEAPSRMSLADRIRRWPRWTARWLLGGWWGLMFVGTHVPLPPSDGEPPIPDKLIHFVMFTLLGLLLPQWRGWCSRVTLQRGLTLWGCLAAYAVADELLQIPVGRTAEWLDGLADLSGGAVGLTLAALAGWFAGSAPTARVGEDA